MRSRLFLAGFGVLAVGAIFFAVRDAEDPKLAAAADAMARAADECLYDVRDRHRKYDDSPSCSSLGVLSMGYLEAGGGRSDTPDKYERKFATARAVAWSALATSEICGRHPLRVW